MPGESIQTESTNRNLTSQSLSRFLLFSMVVLAFFTLLNFRLGFELLSLVEALVLLTLPFAYSWLKRGAPHGIIKHLIGFNTIVIFAPLLFVPTIEDTGIYWIFGYPMIAFFFLGVRTGFLWITIFFLVLIIGVFLAQAGVLTIYNNSTQVAISFAELIVFTAIGYFFVSDREKAERLHLSHLEYLESIERIERALHTGLDLEKCMDSALLALVDIFSCCRAWLFFPSDTKNLSQRVSFEKTAPGIDPVFSSGGEAMINELSQLPLIEALHSGQPVCYGKTNPFPGSGEIIRNHDIRSQMMVALNRDSSQPWLLGLHYCRSEREWSEDERRLFQDIAKRVEDALNQMLLYRELTASESNLRIAIGKAEAASLAKSEFLSTMSHELRTPLHGIIGLQELIATDASNLNEEQRENLLLAQQSAKSLRALVNDVLDLAKIESGNMELVQESFDLFDCIRDALVPFVLTARDKNISLALRMQDVPARIVGDEARLRQVVLNLVGNAVKFTERGGIAITLTTEGDTIHFCVSDTGIGIPSESIDTIFDPFTQVAKSNSSHQQGTGLGTSIVKRFVELMGGDVLVESRLGEGSRFRFRIPCHPVGDKRIDIEIDALTDDLNITASRNREALPYFSGKKLRALLAEDDPIGQRIAVKLLQKAGIEVDAVTNGRDALEMAGSRKYDLLLTDVRMPDISGIELTRMIRQQEQQSGLPRLPIIGLSAHALEEVANECIQAGMDHFMTKPVDPASILSAVLQKTAE